MKSPANPGRFKCLSLEWFRSRREASVIIEAWRQHYNAVRPHQSLNYLTPTEFEQHHQSKPVLQPRAISQDKAFEIPKAGQVSSKTKILENSESQSRSRMG